MRKIEALADGIANYNGFKNAESELYHMRNPGGLKGFSAKHPVNGDGLRIFRSYIDGYMALLYDLDIKCKGNSTCGLTTQSPLLELLRVYGFKDETARYIIKHLRKALKTEQLDANVPVAYFVEE